MSFLVGPELALRGPTAVSVFGSHSHSESDSDGVRGPSEEEGEKENSDSESREGVEERDQPKA